ncbi:MAG TPA: flavodoxin-dependent (E)-4-hydroxy-3-methylbut-2-enyl-diphosphate synthase, partial [Chloroflexota bacterium]
AVREYSDEEYDAELSRVEERFAPLVVKCKEGGISLRIGTNHGSLSDRIMNRFGDTPEGMVESALEFVHVCEKLDYHDIILSMKASNPKVMIAAYRLLAARMAALGMDYPFHLGVTEAGNAEDGRIKSAIGIGSLLEDGIGDTIRVSLTEEPEAEIPVAYAIAGRYNGRTRERSDASRDDAGLVNDPVGSAPSGLPLGPLGWAGTRARPLPGNARTENARALPNDVPWDYYHFERRATQQLAFGGVPVGSDSTVAVVASVDGSLSEQPTAIARILRWASPAGRRQPKPDAAVVTLENRADVDALQRVSSRLSKWPQAQLALVAASQDLGLLREAAPNADAILWRMAGEAEVTPLAGAGAPLILEADLAGSNEFGEPIRAMLCAAETAVDAGMDVMLSLHVADTNRIHGYRLLAALAAELGLDLPILLHASGLDDPLLPASITIGSLLCDGIGDAMMISEVPDSTELAFNILQAAGARISKTDYVACPSCGRTLFDLQETTDRIKQRTSHLVGVKLAIMGCIVNGPGEMADADFGYVGGAPGQVNLYVGKECVEKGVPAEEADDRLIELIKARGKWVEAEEDSSG